MMGRDEIKLRMFVFYFEAVFADADKEQMQRSPIEWLELKGILNSIVKEGKLENNSRVRAIKKKFDFEMARTLKNMPEQDFFLCTFFFYLLVGCDFSRVNSQSENVKRLCDFDFKKILLLIEKNKLRNAWGFSIASRKFRENYWENLNGISHINKG